MSTIKEDLKELAKNFELSWEFIIALFIVEGLVLVLLTINAFDRDNDGIGNIDDKCWKEYGPASADGRPDNDGDGVGDKFDLCPNYPGPVEPSREGEIGDDFFKTWIPDRPAGCGD